MSRKTVFMSIEPKLKPHYSEDELNILDINSFIKIEVLLYLFNKIAPGKDATGAYLLLSRLNLIGKYKSEINDYMLFTARILLKVLRSKKMWEDLLAKYKRVNKAVRLFEFDEEGNLKIKESENIPYLNRKNDYHDLLKSHPVAREHNVKLASNEGAFSFWYNNRSEQIRFPKIEEQLIDAPINKKKGGAITFTVKELILAANEMDRIIGKSDTKNERKNWGESIEKLLFKEVKYGKVTESAKVKIKELCNVVGMVGAGKSTFMNVVAYWAAENNYKIVVVLDSVAEVMKAVRFYNMLQINAVPLLGRYSKFEQLDKVAESSEMFIRPDYARHLTAACPLDGLRGNADDMALNYGEEPCHTLKQNIDGKLSSSYYVCPFYYNCPAKADERGLVSASIVVTTPAGLVYGRAPFPLLGKKMKFAEYIMKDFDLVIFDEADRVQAVYDATFSPASSIDDLLAANAELAKDYMEAQGGRLELEIEERKLRDELMRLPQICDAVKEFINNNKDISNWDRIGSGNSFSAMVLLESEEEIPIELKESLIEYIQEGNGAEEISLIMLRLESGMDDVHNDELITNWLKSYNLESNKWNIRIKFILHLIILEKRLRYISDYGEAAEMDSDSSRRVAGFLRNRFQELQNYLPASVTGNIFGFVYDKDKKILKTFRQFAFGRALMLYLPYLMFDKSQVTVGPNVLLLSGTSWAKGSYKYHIWADVNYILESSAEIRNKIEKTEVVEIPSEIRVSGSGNQRSIMLKDVIKFSKAYISKELDEKPNGRILFVVNSYKEAADASAFIAEQFPQEKIKYMIRDDEEEKAETIRRGEIWRFFKTDARMLIAPAGAIERGHNIVDETGHSVLTSVFFLSRPMGVPGDIEEAVTRLNGKISKYINYLELTDSYERMKEIRKYAYKYWKTMLGGSKYRLDYLNPDEKKDIAVSRLVIIHQIFGRLARITDFNRPAPAIYFADASFKAKDSDGFDLLNEMITWMKEEIESGTEKDIAETLYGPFYRAFKRGLGDNE